MSPLVKLRQNLPYTTNHFTFFLPVPALKPCEIKIFVIFLKFITETQLPDHLKTNKQTNKKQNRVYLRTLNFLKLGRGHYIYTPARRPEDKSKLLSPLLTGPQCMRFHYHMLGNTIGSLTVFIVTNGSRPQVLWIKSRNQGSSWLQANVHCNETGNFQVVWKLWAPIFVFHCKVCGKCFNEIISFISLQSLADSRPSTMHMQVFIFLKFKVTLSNFAHFSTKWSYP
mgnify:CR=1 FL=1